MTLRVVEAADVLIQRPLAIPVEAINAVEPIVFAVKAEGMKAVKRYGQRFGDWKEGTPIVMTRKDLQQAFVGLPEADRELLSRCAERVLVFAQQQRRSLQEMEIAVPGGMAGQRVTPVRRAGCYAPGGRYPLPSSVLMTVCAAKAAEVPEIWVASPRPSPYTLAAAFISGADALLACGGAQAIAALAYGADEVPECDVIAGPGNVYVTAAKYMISQQTRIDMLAGPSELVVIADDTADPAIIAADLLAQAEHDTLARPILISLSSRVLCETNRCLREQLEGLETKEVAKVALMNGFACHIPDAKSAVDLSNRMAPEHLELMVQDPGKWIESLHNFGALFIGRMSAEVLGDYCIGPNHVLPTGGLARGRGGLSVFDFLRVQTWLDISDTGKVQETLEDAWRLSEIEGLAGHARAARARQS